MRIATWNLARRLASAAWREVLDPSQLDVVLLQEATAEALRGLPPHWPQVPGCGWGSAVVPSSGELCAMTVPGYEGWVAGGELLDAECNRPDRRLFVFSLHSPTKRPDAPRKNYVSEVRSILTKLVEQVPEGAELVVGGDFNFISLGERQPGEPLATTSQERKALQQFGEAGLVSCWQAAHPGEPLPHTLRWVRDTTSRFSCDGIFVPMSWGPRIRAEVRCSPRIVEMSDHNPVVATIER